MFNLLNFKYYSFNTKVILSFFIFILFFILIRFSLVIPKTDKEDYNDKIKHINKTITFIKEQVQMALVSIKVQEELEIKLVKKQIIDEIAMLKSSITNLHPSSVEEELKNYPLINLCSYTLKSKDFFAKNIKKENLFNKNNEKLLDQWQIYVKDEIHKVSRMKKRYLFYNTKLKPNMHLVIGCNPYKLNHGHRDFEKELKGYIKRNLTLSMHGFDTKIMFTWINPKLMNDDTRPLYEEDKELHRHRYIVSALSNVRNLTTGNLTAKDIFAARDQHTLEYSLNGEKYIAWISDITAPEDNNFYTLIYAVKKEDIIKRNNSNFFILLPETLVAISIAFIIILMIFKRLFRDINRLTQTAIQVNQGNKSVRSKVKGNDDIGILGLAFDSMLQSFEDNIKTLDLQVEKKTKELSKSLEEKEVLLKEIHHRVKNNLALTIGLIELQEVEIEDESIKKSLIDIQERIFTMELLHRKLYESKHLSNIAFDDYIKDLVESISHNYDLDNKTLINLNIEKINLNIEAALPYGLIINELVTNAFKYAFKDNKEPKLNITIYEKEKNLILIIQDNGKGLEKNFQEITNSSLGLKLINTIVKHQLFGTIQYDYNNGAKFIVQGTIRKIFSLE